MDIIQEYARSGYRIIPLEGKVPDVPKGTDWKKIPKNPNLCRADVLGNYGVQAENHLIIDVDIKKNAPGKKSFKKLSDDAGLEKGWEKQTFVVKTGTGGFHVYLDVPPGVDIGLFNEEYPGLEFRFGPFYVVGPESVHPETKEAYRVVFGHPGALMACPEGILQRILKKIVVTQGEQPKDGFVDDDPLNIERFKEAIAGMPSIPKGAGQTNSLYIVACRGHDFGLSQGKTREIINEFYNNVKLVPPVEQAEIDHVVKSAYTYAKEKAGHLNVAAILKPLK
jgi:Bifunctional DNA primase/polymerase, N-terminal.